MEEELPPLQRCRPQKRWGGGSVCNHPISPDPNTNLQHTGQLVLISFRELSPSRLPEQHHRPNRFNLLGIFPLVWVQLI